jgi:L-serine dehydratase
MESIKSIFKIGYGPSSSHTMGPSRAAAMFYDKNTLAHKFRVHLYGSLALTGRGHLTDIAIMEAMKQRAEIVWHPLEALPFHPNGMLFEAFDEKGAKTDQWEIYSVGGGEIREKDSPVVANPVYPHTTMAGILDHIGKEGGTLWEYVLRHEDPDLMEYLAEVWATMKKAIKRGLDTEGVLPGGLKVQRKAASYHFKARMQNNFIRDNSFLFAYALAVSEENSGGGIVVTAPTCGSCGILPGVLYLFHKNYNVSENFILRAIATAGLIGNLVKTNASISGAEVGCQGEVGTASSMAAAAAAQLSGASPHQIEYAASASLEHHLGLTCDPIGGLVQIPCIERNAFGAQQAVDASLYASNSDGRHFVMFDQVVEAMNQTGKDLPSLYRETSLGGLAKVWDAWKKEGR